MTTSEQINWKSNDVKNERETEPVSMESSLRLEQIDSSTELQRFADKKIGEIETKTNTLLEKSRGIVSENRENGLETTERKEAIIEHFQKERSSFLNDFLNSSIREHLTSETVSEGVNLIPFIGGVKMTGEAAWGQETHGEKLNGKARVIHGAVGATSLALDLTGVGVAGKGIMFTGKSLPVLKRVAMKLAEKGASKSQRILEKTVAFMEKHPELVRQAELYAEEKAGSLIKNTEKYREGNRDLNKGIFSS